MEFLYALIFCGTYAGLLMIGNRRQAVRIERATKRYYEIQIARARARRGWRI